MIKWRKRVLAAVIVIITLCILYFTVYMFEVKPVAFIKTLVSDNFVVFIINPKNKSIAIDVDLVFYEGINIIYKEKLNMNLKPYETRIIDSKEYLDCPIITNVEANIKKDWKIPVLTLYCLQIMAICFIFDLAFLALLLFLEHETFFRFFIGFLILGCVSITIGFIFYFFY